MRKAFAGAPRPQPFPGVLALVGVVAALGASACTLLNSFDAVKPLRDGGDQGEAGLEASAGDASDSAVTDAATDATVSDAVSDARADAEAGPPPDKGVIVVGGVASAADGGVDASYPDAGLVSVLTALAPEDGTELPLAREKLNVASVQYDGLRDLWYVFESGGAGFFPTPTDPVFLHVRQLHTATGAWTTLQSLPVPPLVAFTLVTVLRNRLVYVAYDVSDGQVGTELVTVDTTDPSNPVVYDTQPLDQQPFGLIGTRGASGSGGVVNLLQSSACGDGGQCFSIQHVTIPPATSDKPNVTPMSGWAPLGPYVGSPAYGSFLTGPQDVIGWSTHLPNASISSYSPQVPGQSLGSPIPFSSNDGYFKPFAFAECLGQALLMGTNQDLAVYAIPLTTTGTVARGTLGTSGQGVYYEPFTSTVLAPFSQGDGFTLTAFTLGGTKAAPTLTPRQAPGWAPPPDLRPELVATRTHVPTPTCP